MGVRRLSAGRTCSSGAILGRGRNVSMETRSFENVSHSPSAVSKSMHIEPPVGRTSQLLQHLRRSLEIGGYGPSRLSSPYDSGNNVSHRRPHQFHNVEIRTCPRRRGQCMDPVCLTRVRMTQGTSIPSGAPERVPVARHGAGDLPSVTCPPPP